MRTENNTDSRKSIHHNVTSDHNVTMQNQKKKRKRGLPEDVSDIWNCIETSFSLGVYGTIFISSTKSWPIDFCAHCTTFQ